MPDFGVRSVKEEIMDDLTCSGAVVDQTLRELETINRLLGGNYVTADGVNKLLRDHPYNEPVSIADVGCGGGDILKLLALQMRKKGIKATFIGIDANPHIIEYASKNTKDFPEIRYEAIDIFSDSFKEKQFDIVTGTLFFHHFSSEQLADFFRQLKDQVRLGIVINDIHRHWVAYHFIRWLTTLFSKSTMVKHDAPVSVLRAFSKNDWREILQKAGISNYTVQWMMAYRWQVIIKTP